MRSAFFESEGGEFKFVASEILSEWLIVQKFWHFINIKCDTNFDQYEDDDADLLVIGCIIECLSVKKQELISTLSNSISFTYAWTKDQPISVVTEKSVLLRDLDKLIKFLRVALKKQLNITCYL